MSFFQKRGHSENWVHAGHELRYGAHLLEMLLHIGRPQSNARPTPVVGTDKEDHRRRAQRAIPNVYEGTEIA
jgi:hypothetical protein